MSLFNFFGKKTAAEKYIAADKKVQKLRDKRSNLDPYSPNYEVKKNRINGKIHKENVKMKVAEMEMKYPATNNNTTNVNANLTVNNNKTSKELHLHGHYHSGKKKK